MIEEDPELERHDRIHRVARLPRRRPVDQITHDFPCHGDLRRDEDRASDAELTDDLPLVVFDDEVVLDDGSMTALVGAKVNRGSIAYRDMLAEDISRLYLTRQRIAIEQQWVADEPLYERVLRALQIEEIEAQLDALTEGAVTRWNEGNPGGQP